MNRVTDALPESPADGSIRERAMMVLSPASRRRAAATFRLRLLDSASRTTRVISGSLNSASQPVVIVPSFPADAADQVPGVRIERSPTGAAKRHDSQPEKPSAMQEMRSVRRMSGG